ncbi:1-deoxy-D-xylulose-5-phosphate reductoisomerase [Alkalibacillus haloalkaliphilus]|uniref:1-deoxy-D-xylulose 5-phosphate reductoisomerase n=1 Tax=Alkalibacillus haloalkaliphilus TaxID=94136 RepID=A0A511W1N3_9BACI|nr:1-deoxy-D-xylulose-5-phosphate reductoisomerase [Alkalibacillus haloalkaliphilus]GEN44954.1 1-deoxy-D-xylulose 5-phosphate reductoisomerase 2 [Alkalibacillus haloalkaliphilus]
MKNIVLLGGTGSIGLQTIDIIKEYPDAFNLYALAFGTQVDVAKPIIEELKPQVVIVKDGETKSHLESTLTYDVKVYAGLDALSEIVKHDQVDLVVNALLGSVGLKPTLEAIRAKKQIAFANKETLVTAGHLVMEEARKYGVDLLPVDSEHAAIHQCLRGENLKELKRMVITASGGSFRDRTREELVGVTKEDALKHPNWSMGAKITIDSATMMNKGLEVIEAHWLFGVPYDQIDVIMHKESVIHSMVEFTDQSVMAQLGTPDMRIPIQYALTYPERYPYNMSEGLDLLSFGTLNFQEMSFERFPCLKMAYESGREGGSMTTVLNAANEEAVSLFLNGKVDFLGIENLIQNQLEQHKTITSPDLGTILTIDQETRERVRHEVS